MSIQESITNFITAIEANNMRGSEILEITVGKGLFIDLLAELPTQDYNQGDLFRGYLEVPDHVTINLPFGVLKVNRG